jgi:hypothetical protein
MAIDASIALGVKPVQLESPLNQMSNVYALQNAAQSNQLNQLKMEEYKKGLAEEDQFKNALLSSKDDAGIKNAFYSLGQKGVKAYADYQKSNIESKKLGYETDKLKNDLLEAKLKQSKEFLSTVTTPEQYLAWHEANHSDPVLGPALAARGVTQDTARAEIEAAMAKPGGFQELLQKSALGLAKFTELNKPNIHVQNLNNKSNVLSVPGLGGAPTTLSSTPMGISPEAQQRLAYEGQRVGIEKQRLGNEQNPNVVAHQQVSENGTVTNFNKFGQVIGTVEGVGKPSAQFTKTKEQTKKLNTDLNMAITELENATKNGGLIDQSTGSGLGKAANAVRGFVTGGASAGAIAGAKLAPIADLALKMVPRFEGPQSDKDTQSYKEAAGQLADTSIPNEIRKEAGKTVLRLMKARKNQFVTSEMSQEGVVPSAGGVDSSNPLLK